MTCERSVNNWILKKIEESFTVSFLPQYLYLYDRTNTQIIQHILRFDNLNIEFENLMRLYQLPLKLNKHDNKARKQGVLIKKFDQSDLYPETKNQLMKFYEKDFETFNFEADMNGFQKKWYHII